MNSYINPACVAPSDTWHHGEQITTWFQVNGLNQGIYSDFFPSSGTFSVPIGALVDFFGGKATHYAAAYSLIAMIFAIITASLCRMLGGEKVALIVALGAGVLIYNRGLLILPYLLILTLPKVINNRSYWLKSWIVLSLVNGLYYPAIGISLLFATMPFGIVQLVLFFKTEWKEKRVKAGFWCSSGLVLAGILICSKLLLNMATYILSLVGQSLEADSFTLLSYTKCPDFFMTFLPDGYRFILYLFFRLSISGLVVVLPVTLFFILRRRQDNTFISSPMSFALSSSAIFMVSYFSYSLLRADAGTLLSRTGVGVFNISLYLAIVIYRYGNKYMTEKLVSLLFVVLFSTTSLSFAFSSSANFPQVDMGVKTGGVVNDADRLMPYYDINPEQYLYTPSLEGNEKEWIGEGFIRNDNYSTVIWCKQFIDAYGLENEYFLNLPRFYYFLLNVKAAYVDSTLILQSEEAQKHLLEHIEDKNPVVTSYNIALDYELVKWMQKKNYVVLENGWC